jgi:dephospho-CoA kinase
MKIIGVTGGIGSGKSTVCKFVSSNFSVEIIDADILAKKTI